MLGKEQPSKQGSITVKPFDRHRWLIKASYFSQALREVCYQVPGMAFDWDVKGYVGYPDSVEIALGLLEEKKVRFDRGSFDPEEHLVKIENIPEPQIPVARKDRRGYQNLGVNFLIWQGASGALLADAPRLGKSIQALTAARAFKERTLIVAPSHVIGVWARSNPSAVPRPGRARSSAGGRRLSGKPHRSRRRARNPIWPSWKPGSLPEAKLSSSTTTSCGPGPTCSSKFSTSRYWLSTRFMLG